MHRNDWLSCLRYQQAAKETKERCDDLLDGGDFFDLDDDEADRRDQYGLAKTHIAYPEPKLLAQYFTHTTLATVAAKPLCMEMSGMLFMYVEPWMPGDRIGVDILSALLYEQGLLPGPARFHISDEDRRWLERAGQERHRLDEFWDVRDPSIDIGFLSSDYSAEERQERLWAIDAAKLLHGRMPSVDLWNDVGPQEREHIDRTAADLVQLTIPFDLFAPGSSSLLFAAADLAQRDAVLLLSGN